MRFQYSIFLSAFLISACAVGPDYDPVRVESALVDQEWHGALPHGGKVADLTRWWFQFDDPVMTLLIERAENDSPTLDAALARISQARASLRKSDASLFPTATGSASVTRTLTSVGSGAARQTSGLGGGTTQQTTGMGGAAWQTAKTAGLDAGWEIDLFGGKRRAVEQSEAQLQSNEASWHDARVSLAAEVADAYVNYRACQSDRGLYEQRFSSQSDTLGLVSLKADAGLVSASDRDLSEASAADIASTLENQKGVCAQKFNLIAQLTGVPSDDLSHILSTKPDEVPVPRAAEITALPAVAIEQRPDVAVAERNLAAASAAIGVAEAERFPSLSLSGAISINKTSGSSNVSTWSFGPSLSLPIFNAGSLEAEEDRTRAVMDETVATYRKTVRAAVNEVEDALARLDAVNRRMKQAESSVDRYHRYLNATEANYKAGSVSLLDLEETRRTVYSAEETLVAARQEQAEAWIAMYKAVGGGWNNKIETE
jgi:multidrug efflux system outer membrane protein